MILAHYENTMAEPELYSSTLKILREKVKKATERKNPIWETSIWAIIFMQQQPQMQNERRSVKMNSLEDNMHIP